MFPNESRLSGLLSCKHYKQHFQTTLIILVQHQICAARIGIQTRLHRFVKWPLGVEGLLVACELDFSDGLYISHRCTNAFFSKHCLIQNERGASQCAQPPSRVPRQHGWCTVQHSHSNKRPGVMSNLARRKRASSLPLG